MPALTTAMTPRIRSFLLLLALGVALPGCSLLQLEEPDQPAKDFVEAASIEQTKIEPANSEQAKIESASANNSHVYVYFIHGIDPLDWANLNGVEQYTREQGFCNTMLVTMHQGAEVVANIQSVKARDPQARIVIFGYSAGAATTKKAMNTLHDHHGINVDVVIYVSGITLLDFESTRPAYVGKIVQILDGGKIIPGVKLTNAENYRINDVWHFSSPMHPLTLSILKTELEHQTINVTTVAK